MSINGIIGTWLASTAGGGGRAWPMEFHRFTMRMESDAEGNVAVHLSPCSLCCPIARQVNLTVLTIWLIAVSRTKQKINPPSAGYEQKKIRV